MLELILTLIIGYGILTLFGLYIRYKERQNGIEVDDNKDDPFKYHRISEKQKYMKSPKWIKLRNEIVFRDNSTCQICGSSEIKLNVHHITYDNLEHEKLEDLTTLCEKCHSSLHNDLGYNHENNYPILGRKQALKGKFHKSKTKVYSIYYQQMSHINGGKKDELLVSIPNTKQARKKTFERIINHDFKGTEYKEILSDYMMSSLVNSLTVREKQLIKTKLF